MHEKFSHNVRKNKPNIRIWARSATGLGSRERSTLAPVLPK